MRHTTQPCNPLIISRLSNSVFLFPQLVRMCLCGVLFLIPHANLIAQNSLKTPQSIDTSLLKQSLSLSIISIINKLDTTSDTLSGQRLDIMGIDKISKKPESANINSLKDSRDEKEEQIASRGILQELGVMQNAWFYYFSSLAQTIAGGSALLVALTVLRLQALENSLYSVERLLSLIFNHIGKQNEYNSEASHYFLNAQWDIYFQKVAALTKKHKLNFLDSYTYSLAYVKSIINRGRFLESASRKLHSALTLAFGSSVAFAGAAILVLPLAKWLTANFFFLAWTISGIFLVVLFILYFRLLMESVTYQRLRRKS
jgi:hypothetical protein